MSYTCAPYLTTPRAHAPDPSFFADAPWRACSHLLPVPETGCRDGSAPVSPGDLGMELNDVTVVQAER